MLTGEELVRSCWAKSNAKQKVSKQENHHSSYVCWLLLLNSQVQVVPILSGSPPLFFQRSPALHPLTTTAIWFPPPAYPQPFTRRYKMSSNGHLQRMQSPLWPPESIHHCHTRLETCCSPTDETPISPCSLSLTKSQVPFPSATS